MKTKIETKRDKILLKKAKKIFGNIIKNAYVAMEAYEGISKEDIQKRLNYIKFKEDNKNSIDFDRIILVFTNNKAVMFTTSEWAWIEEVDKPE